MSKIEYRIDGNKFHSKNGFYNYIEEMFTFNLGWKIGRNLNAFDDVLRGGFGKHDYEEKIIIKWENYKKSENRLNSTFFKAVIEILEEHENVEFYRVDYRN